MAILCYHSVEPGWSSALAVSPEAFAAHCAWLARHKRVLSLGEAVAKLDGSMRLPRRSVALTFDDGFASLYEHARRVLARLGLPWTVFVVSGTLVPGGRPVDWVDDPPVAPLRALTRDQVVELHEQGVTFGSHSNSHRDLTALTEEECQRDLRESREVLEDLLRHPVQFLAYPRGRHDERVRRAAERAGFTHAFTLPEAREPAGPHAVPRVGVYPGNGLTALRLKSSRWYLPLRTSSAFAALHRRTRPWPRASRLPG